MDESTILLKKIAKSMQNIEAYMKSMCRDSKEKGK